ncbi:Uncharacterized protein TPAR_01626 [Tolypocladium paradoxum]|uniref:Uncharacterized protein n=1 Tax=Tolypocladium paradoxum TaxID=94208 RepID=A0A2S4L6U1_9HYPO|nr:Uncharacterized protein TPAR_01626 [Tolypocladium paradoxum]
MTTPGSTNHNGLCLHKRDSRSRCGPYNPQTPRFRCLFFFRFPFLLGSPLWPTPPGQQTSSTSNPLLNHVAATRLPLLTLLSSLELRISAYCLCLATLRRLGNAAHLQSRRSQGRALQPVAELAQLRSQTLLWAEPSFDVITNDNVGLLRGSYVPASGRCANSGGRHTINVDIVSLLKASDSNESSVYTKPSRPASVPQSTAPVTAHGQLPAQVTPPVASGPMPNARRSMPPQVSDQPVKKQSKWSPEEDTLIIELRGSGMKWEDVSKRLPGRSAISCRLHYQNYLERRSEWDEERKNKLARLYERYGLPDCRCLGPRTTAFTSLSSCNTRETNKTSRFKAEMWAKVAEELAVPWRAAEAMHWQLGEADMARRAGVVPFSLAAVNVESGQRSMPPRPSSHFQLPDNLARHLTPPSPRSMYTRNPQLSAMPVGQATRGDLMPSQPQAPGPPGLPLPMTPDHGELYYTAGPGLAPIQTQGQPRNPGPLPSLAELTTGVSPYGTPVERQHPGPLGPVVQHGALMPATQGYQMPEPTRSKRRASPEMMQRENSRRRRLG